MKISEARRRGKDKFWSYASIRKNPGSSNQWFAMVADEKQMSYMLVDDQEKPIVSEDLNSFVELLSPLGIQEFSVFI